MRILIVEDEELFAIALRKRLAKNGHESTIAGTLEAARGEIETQRRKPYDLVLLDERLPDGSGLELMADKAASGEPIAPFVIVMTAFAEIDHAVEAMKLGAFDYLKKPVDLDQLSVAVEKVHRAVPRTKTERTTEGSQSSEGPIRLIGDTPIMADVRARIREFAAIGDPDKPLPTVLILGETGTGKDVAARLIHAWGPRRDRPFVEIDCTSLPRDLIEAELFGYERGAFTGARESRFGLVLTASSGAVFLNEIGELPLDLQSKLLSLIDRRRVRPVGGNRESEVKARFIAATNRNLEEMVAAGGFRADLFYRLKVLTLTMPPLRDRRADIPLLARFFADQVAEAFSRPSAEFSQEAMAKLGDHYWPGNCRELKHTIERVVLLNRGDPVTTEDIEIAMETPPVSEEVPIAKQSPRSNGTASLADVEKEMIESALRKCSGNVSKAARLLNTTRMKLRYRIEKHGIEVPKI